MFRISVDLRAGYVTYNNNQINNLTQQERNTHHEGLCGVQHVYSKRVIIPRPYKPFPISRRIQRRMKYTPWSCPHGKVASCPP